MARPSRRQSTAEESLFPERKFDQRLVLYQWMLDKLRVKSFEALADQLKDPQFEGFDEDNTSRFYHRLTESLFDDKQLSKDILLGYDQNIVRYWKQITERRGKYGIVQYPKYFQYLSLLFIEIYLDQYFRDQSKLLSDLNDYVSTFNQNVRTSDRINAFVESDLNKLAVWKATGSGKTLIMHINMMQYKHYLKLNNRFKELHRTILLTPNEGLSLQHLEEFQLSGINAEMFSKEERGLFAGDAIEIIDIHKLKDDMGEKTVAIDAFEGNNLVLVDEGHRGASGVEWMDKRNKLVEEGFSFEYSATFGQAIKAANNGKLTQEYAKCIIFDYSYKYFYRDGYGKDYRILNLADDTNDGIRNLYLIGSLLSYYQQLKIYTDKKKSFTSYLIDKPLLVFVGSKVKAVRTENKRKVSDVLDALLFLSDFVRKSHDSKAAIEQLLFGTQVFLNTNQQYVFSNQFSYLISSKKKSEEIFSDMLQLIFNAAVPAALHIENLKGSDGEIGLRFGDNQHFGVINIGDVSEFMKLCEEQPELVTDEKDFSESLFRSLNKPDSELNVLIGAKKFTEGWNSYRVSTMGLLNVGKSEGSEIIQLFGRGVRLRGYNNCLKRSKFVLGVKHPDYIDKLETLNVFGVRSNYMQQFKEYLEDEGLPSGDVNLTFTLPVINNLGTKKLKILQLQDGIDFKKNGPKPTLEKLSFDELRFPVELDWYPKIQARQSKGIQSNSDVIEKKEGKLSKEHIAFFDWDKIFFSLMQFKNEKSWYNLCLPKDAIKQLLTSSDWYVLYIDPEEMTMKDFARIRMWEEIAITLLQKYTDRYYKYRKGEYEAPYLEYRELKPDDPNFVNEYEFTIEQSQTSIIAAVKHVKELIETNQLKTYKLGSQFEAIFWGNHLYEPLIHIDSQFVDVRPVPLNDGERDFVTDLIDYNKNNEKEFEGKELYLLRNRSRGRGMGFFEAGNFYPDFVMWLVKDGKQYISFMDPKGVRNLRGLKDLKIQFYKKIKELEARLGNKNVILNSFIISQTPYEQVSWWEDKLTEEEFEKRNVIFKESSFGYLRKILNKLN